MEIKSIQDHNIYKTAIRNPKLRMIGNTSSYNDTNRVSFEYIDAKHILSHDPSTHYSSIKMYLEYIKLLKNKV